jgi:hypothetical protein
MPIALLDSPILDRTAPESHRTWTVYLMTAQMTFR